MFKKVSLLLLSTLTVGFIVQASATTSAVKRRSVAAPQRLHHPKSHAGTPPSTTKIDQKAALPEAFVGRPEASWEIGGDWGQGVLRTLERGAEDNQTNLVIFHHVNYPSVWGLHVLHRYDLGGRWRLGWQLGYRDLGKTSGTYDRVGGLSTRLLRGEGFDGLLRIDYALSRDWGVYGALGGMVWQLHRSVEGDNGIAYPGDASRTQMDPEYALGLRYRLSPLVLTLSYDRVQGSETGAVDRMASEQPNAHLDPTSSSVLLGISYGLGSPTKRARDLRSGISGWELGFSWGEGVLRTLERGAEDNITTPSIFTHKNHGSVWGVGVLHRYDLEGGLSLGWELGYRDLGKTSGSYDINGRLSTRLLRGEGFDGLLRVDYALSRDWGVYGALGGMVWQLHRSVEGENGDASPGDASRTQIDPEYALGLRYVLSPLVLTLSYDRVQGSETAVEDRMGNGGDNAHLDPTSSSVLLGISYGLGSPVKRVRDMRSTISGWELGFSWGEGVLRTLERGSEDNQTGLLIYTHKNHGSVWGLNVLHRYGLGGGLSLGWELGYRDLGKTSGTYDRVGRLSTRLLRGEGFDGLLRIDYALSRDWGVYGALGGMVWQLHRSVEGDNGVAYPGDASRTQIDPEYALGLRYRLSPLVLTLSYDRVQGSETAVDDRMGNGGDNAHLDPTSTSVLLGISYGLGRPLKRVRDMRSTISGWELGFSWGEGVLRTLERGAEDNFATPLIFTHKNHGSVWGVGVLHRYDLEGGLSLGWELGYRDLGKTSGTYDRPGNGGLSTRLLRGEGFDGLLRVDYALSRDWGVYGALGGMVWQLHRSVEGANGDAYPGDASRTQIDPEYALGLRYVLSPLVLTLSYDRVQGSETAVDDRMAGGGDNAHLDPTSTSVLLGISYGLGRPLKRVRDMRSTISGWELGFSWGEGVLRTLERGAEDNDATPSIYTHKNHGSVWGVGVLHRYDLEGGLSLGWELGYRDLGKTSGTYDRPGNGGLSTRLLRGEGFDGLLRIDYALSRDWGVYGALGGMVWQLHRSVEGDNGAAYPGDASRTQIDPEYALGLRYVLSPLVLTLSYDRVQGSETGAVDRMANDGPNAHLDPTSSSVLLGVAVTF